MSSVHSGFAHRDFAGGDHSGGAFGAAGFGRDIARRFASEGTSGASGSGRATHLTEANRRAMPGEVPTSVMHVASLPLGSSRSMSGVITDGDLSGTGRSSDIANSSGLIVDFASRMPAPPSSGARPVFGTRSAAAAASTRSTTRSSRSAAARAAQVQVRRSSVTSLPVSGSGSMAAGVASSVAGDIARDVVETALTQRFEQSSKSPSANFVSRDAAGGVQRQVAEGAADRIGEASLADEGAQQDELLRFAMSDAFEERLMEFLEDRLLGEIERRGGRYGGGFA